MHSGRHSADLLVGDQEVSDVMKKTPVILVSDQQTACCFDSAALDLIGWKMAEVLLDPVTSVLNIFHHHHLRKRLF